MCLKNGKLKIVLGLLSVLLTVPTWADSGGQDGGGGGVIQCVDPNTQPLWTSVYKMINGKWTLAYEPMKAASTLPDNQNYELLDLWEPETGNGPFFGHKLTIPFDVKDSVDSQIAMAAARLARNLPEFAGHFNEFLPMIRKMAPIPTGNYVLPPEDTMVRYLPLGCNISGLGFYSDSDENLIYDPEVFGALSTVDQAAFFVHETAYKVFRKYYQESNSWHTRRLVGLLFSTQETFTWNQVINGFLQK